MTRIAIIDNSIDPDVYRPVRHWSRWLTGDWAAFAARKGRLPLLDDGFSHIILTGSEASILERPPWAEAEVALVRDALARGLPILGSCYGHQLLALAIGGPRYIRRCVEPEIGWIPIRVLGNDPLLGPARTAYAFTLHFDEVVDPDGLLTVLAGTSVCPIHAFRYGAKPVWGVQSHPEIDPDDGRELLVAELEKGLRGGPDDRAGPAFQAPGRRARSVGHRGIPPSLKRECFFLDNSARIYIISRSRPGERVHPKTRRNG